MTVHKKIDTDDILKTESSTADANPDLARAKKLLSLHQKVSSEGLDAGLDEARDEVSRVLAEMNASL